MIKDFPTSPVAWIPRFNYIKGSIERIKFGSESYLSIHEKEKQDEQKEILAAIKDEFENITRRYESIAKIFTQYHPMDLKLSDEGIKDYELLYDLVSGNKLDLIDFYFLNKNGSFIKEEELVERLISFAEAADKILEELNEQN